MKRLFVTASLLVGTMVFAGGFRVSLQGVKQLAQAHTSAHTEDASVAFFNPAGISFIPNKLSIVAGGFGVVSNITYQNPMTLESYDTNSPIGTPISAAAAYKVSKDVSVGFSFTTPFGSTVDWGNQWAGQEIVQKMQLKSFFFQPMVSVKLADWVSLGGSYIYAKGEVNWDKAVSKLGGKVNIKDKEASGQGFSLGFYFKPNEKLDVSVAYRSPVDIEAKNGKITVNASKAVFSTLQLDANGQDRFKATLPLVDEYTIGTTYKITPRWSVSADFNYTGWSRYDELTLDFDKTLLGNQTDATILTTPKNFKNTQTWRVGTEYKLTNKLAGRLGYYFDESPYDDANFIPETPSFDNQVITAGFGYKFSHFGVDVAGGYSFLQPRNVANAYNQFYGQAKGNAFYFGLGLSYNPF